MSLLIENFNSTILQRKRKVRVYLPEEYDSDPERHFPVLFTADGQLKFTERDAELPYGSWTLDEHLERLVARGEVPPTIVIGVDNSPARMKEYFPVTPEFALYERFLLEDLIPWARATFRLLDGPQNTAHIGSSMGGMVSFALAMNHPHVFGTALCLSPWFEHEQNRYIHESLRLRTDKPPIRVWMDSGIRDWRGLDDGYRGMLLARLELLRLGYTEGEDFAWAVDTRFPTEEEIAADPRVKPEKARFLLTNQHTEFTWRRRLQPILRWGLGPGTGFGTS